LRFLKKFFCLEQHHRAHRKHIVRLARR
jgi:hypothetical protein